MFIIDSKSGKDRRDPQWMQAVVDNVMEGVLVEAGEQVIYANPAYAAMLGYTRPQDLLHQPISSLVAEEDAARLVEFSRRRKRLESAPQSYDFLARRKDESTVRLAVSVSTAVVDGQVIITTLARPFYVSTPQQVAAQPAAAHALLSPREREVLEMILAGKRMKEIALQMNVSQKTVSTHRTRLLRKLNLPDNRALFQYALRHGLIDWT